MSLAVVTLNKGRGAHLARLLEGLAKGRAPDRCIVVEMGGDTTPLPPLPFPVERIPLAGEGLPLAAARNAGRRAAGAAGHAKAAGYKWDTINQTVLDTYLRVIERRSGR